MNIRSRPVVAAAIIIGIVVLAFALIGFVREYVAPFLLSLIWRAYLMGDSIPQIMIWAVFVALIPILAIFVLIQGRAGAEEDDRKNYQENSGQVLKWSKFIRRSGSGDYFKRRLIRELSDLTIATLQYRERMTEEEVKEAMRSGELPLKPGIYDYLAQSWRREYFAPTTEKSRSNWLTRLLKTNGSAGADARWKDPNIEKVVEFLEEELEVESGSGNIAGF